MRVMRNTSIRRAARAEVVYDAGLATQMSQSDTPRTVVKFLTDACSDVDRDDIRQPSSVTRSVYHARVTL